MNPSSLLATGVAALLVAACSTSASSDSPKPSSNADATAQVVADSGAPGVQPPVIVADSGAVDAAPPVEAFLIKCEGINSCKGTSECKSATNACKGLNDCAGHGYILVPEAECVDKKGKVLS